MEYVMNSYFLMIFLALQSGLTFAANLKSDTAGINNKLRIDFTVSEELFDKQNILKKHPLEEMRKISEDHALKIKGEVTGVTLALNPLIDNNSYSYFFTFNVKTKEEPNLNCISITDKEFSKYSAACYHSKH